MSGNESSVQKRGRKVYFHDGAVRNAALQRGLAPLTDPAEMGLLLENLAAASLHTLALHEGTKLHHWRDGKDEVDLLHDHATQPLAFEIGSSARHSTLGLVALQQRHRRFAGRCYLVAPDAPVRRPEESSDSVGSLPFDRFLVAVGRQAEHALDLTLAARVVADDRFPSVTRGWAAAAPPFLERLLSGALRVGVERKRRDRASRRQHRADAVRLGGMTVPSRRGLRWILRATAVVALGVGSPSTAGASAATAADSPTALTLEQKVGQLFMVGMSSASPPSGSQLSMLRSYRVGNVMLAGRTEAGVAATASISGVLRAVTTQGRIRPFIATDQEGGLVQVLRGPGFSAMPTALSQGTLASDTLRAYAGIWGRQLAAAGINLNLAPVLDTVPGPNPTSNQPIGRYYREFGHTPGHVASSGTAFLQGMRQAGVGTAIKHFPGLGRATGNTDVTAGVTDPTTRHDPYLRPFAAGIAAGSPFVMVSTATYPSIDPSHQAAFSPTVLGSVLRGDLGFAGVVISDDLGNATSVLHLTPATRALSFFGGGGDLLLTGNAPAVPSMVSAVIAAARASTAFAARIDAAVNRVLLAKTAAGLNPRTRGDFTGDGRADAAVFRPTTGTWWVRGLAPVPWGRTGDVPVSGDFTGDGRADIAVFRPSTGTWWVRGVATVPWGRTGDVPVSGDFTGDGRADIAVFRPSTGTWWVRGVATVPWGRTGDVPVSGDFTGDGRADIAVFRPSTGTWWVRGVATVPWGRTGDVPVSGDFTGDGRADIAVFRPSTGTWWIRGQAMTSWGTSIDIPTPADYTGDGRADIAVFRPSTGTWWVRGVSTFRFGLPGDIPLR